MSHHRHPDAAALPLADHRVGAGARADGRDAEVRPPARPWEGAVDAEHDPHPVAIRADPGGTGVPGQPAFDGVREGAGPCAGGVPGQGLALQVGERSRGRGPAAVRGPVQYDAEGAPGIDEETGRVERVRDRGRPVGPGGLQCRADHADGVREVAVHTDTAPVGLRSLRSAR